MRYLYETHNNCLISNPLFYSPIMLVYCKGSKQLKCDMMTADTIALRTCQEPVAAISACLCQAWSLPRNLYYIYSPQAVDGFLPAIVDWSKGWLSHQMWRTRHVAVWWPWWMGMGGGGVHVWCTHTRVADAYTVQSVLCVRIIVNGLTLSASMI